MNKLSCYRRLLAIGLLLTSGFALAVASDKPAQPQQTINDVQDLVFLGEARPVLIRMHVRLDGKTIEAAWADYLKHLFAYLDVNGDGVLDADEAERVPTIEQIQNGVLGVLQGGRRRAPQPAKMDKMEMKGKDSKKGGVKKKADVPAKEDVKKKSDVPTKVDTQKKTEVLTEKDADKKSTVVKKGEPGKDSKTPATPKPAAAPVEEVSIMSELDTNKDGKVTLAELAAYYRKSGLQPFRVHFSAPQSNQFDQLAFLRGGAEPTAQAISDAIFAALDTNSDGKLSRAELAAASTVLLRMDEDEDEMLTTRELVPKSRSNVGSMIVGYMSKSKGPSADEGRKTLIPLARPGEVPGDLVKAMQTRYGPKTKKPEEKKLSRKDLGLDEATFRRLDTNGDGVLDAKELAGFVKIPPDIELTVRLGDRQEAEAAVQAVAVKGQPSTLAGKLTVKDDVAMLDLGVTRAEVRTSDEETPMDTFVSIIRQQLVAQFKIADKANKGYLDKEDAKKNGLFGNLFKAIDRDNDGKITVKELNDFLDKVVELQARATASSVTVVLSFDSRGLFDLLDTNGDGRLGVREMLGAAGLLEKFDRDKKGYLTKADIPKTAKLTLRRGPSGEIDPQLKAFSAIYGGGGPATPERQSTAGPLWFRKMDRNRDGDVSRKEWIFSEELFRKIDTNGDGLISLEEAQRYEAMRGKGK